VRRAALVASVALASVAGCGREESPPPPSRSKATDNPIFAQGLEEIREDRIWPGLWHLTLVLRDDPSHHGALSGLGIYAYRQGRWDDVPTYLEPLALVRPLVWDEMLALADASLKLNRFAKAESLFVLSGVRRPPNPQVLVALGTARRRQGELDAAAADFRRAADLDPANDEARLSLAEILLDLDRVQEAAAALAVVPDTTAQGARFHLLRARVSAGHDAAVAAVSELEKCLALEPENLDALHLLMQEQRRLGRLDLARDAARRHREALAAMDRRGPALAGQALVQGAIAMERGDEAAALSAWEKGLADDPENTNLHCVLAPLYQKLGRRDDALASFTVLRKAMNGEVPGPLFLATGHELRRRGLSKAAAGQYEIAVNRMPESEEAIYFHALALSETGDWDAAVAAAARLE